MYNKLKTNGTLLAWFGVILLAPDALLIRFSGLDGIALLFWRGLLAGGTLLILWMCFSGDKAKQDWAVILSPIGLFFVLIHVINVIAFALGITMTSAVVMLTGLATMPLFTILFSIPILGERPNWQTWLAVMFCMFGILIVVLSGHQAIGAPKGSPIIGGFLGVSAAAGLGLTMVLKRRNPKLPILLSAGWANIISVILAWAILGQQIPTLPQTALGLTSLMIMGTIILPIAFFALMVAPRYTSATTVGLIMLTESIMGPLWVWLGTTERPSPLMALGSAIVIASLGYYFLRAEKGGSGS